MVKIFLFLSFFSFGVASSEFQKQCIQCHEKEGIPTDALYKRYLVKYSSKKRIKEVMFQYLKNPSIEKSIMPAPFIHKFGLQKPMDLPDTRLKRYIDMLVEKYDVRNQLYLPTNQDREKKLQHRSTEYPYSTSK